MSNTMVTWAGPQPVENKAQQRNVDRIEAALVAGLGGAARAELFVQRSGAAVLLAALFEGSDRGWAYAEPFEQHVWIRARQALGIVQAYYDERHSGAFIFMKGLPAVEWDDCDDYGGVPCHRYYSRSADLYRACAESFRLCAR